MEKTIFKDSLIIFILLLIFSSFISLNFFLGILAGGLFCIFNYYFLLKVIEKLERKKHKVKKRFFVLYGCKFLVVSTLLMLMLIYIHINIFPLIVGLSLVVMAVFIEALKLIFLGKDGHHLFAKNIQTGKR